MGIHSLTSENKRLQRVPVLKNEQANNQRDQEYKNPENEFSCLYFILDILKQIHNKRVLSFKKMDIKNTYGSEVVRSLDASLQPPPLLSLTV